MAKKEDYFEPDHVVRLATVEAVHEAAERLGAVQEIEAGSHGPLARKAKKEVGDALRALPPENHIPSEIVRGWATGAKRDVRWEDTALATRPKAGASPEL